MTEASRKPVRSMTGYARIRQVCEQGEIVVSVRGVNHRGLDLHMHLPPGLEAYESAFRRTIAGRVTRGHLSVGIQFTPGRGEVIGTWNRPLIEAWLAAFRSAAKEYGLAGEPDLNSAFRIPGMLAAGGEDEREEELERELVAALSDALERFNGEREREGIETAQAIRMHGEKIVRAAAEMEEIRAAIVPALRVRLEERLKELLGGVALEPARLMQEAALLADRSDIGEEVTRLKIHAGQLLELLSAGGEVGKKLEFLSQEMQREANTILSKSNWSGEPGRAIVELGLGVKSEIEKVREQLLNLE